MPRKTKDQIEKENEENTKKKSTKTTTKKSTTKSVAKKSTSTKTPTKKATTKKVATSTKDSIKKASTTKKTTTKSNTKKASTTKTKKTKNNLDFKPEIVEYYDLPYRYNQTIVKVLAQTPNTLFVYWDISDYDRENYKKQYGENFFETTKPILVIHNRTLDYSFEVEINDFANSWYLSVGDSKCNYEVELGRRPINNNKNLNSDYIYVSSSNTIESPNDNILVNTNHSTATFRNVKNNEEFNKSILDLKIAKNINNIYNIYDLYKLIYNDENIYNHSNPSSNISSDSFSSK